MTYITAGELRAQYPDVCPECGHRQFTEHGDSRYERIVSFQDGPMDVWDEVEDQGYHKPTELTCNECYATVWEKES